MIRRRSGHTTAAFLGARNIPGTFMVFPSRVMGKSFDIPSVSLDEVLKGRFLGSDAKLVFDHTCVEVLSAKLSAKENLVDSLATKYNKVLSDLEFERRLLAQTRLELDEIRSMTVFEFLRSKIKGKKPVKNTESFKFEDDSFGSQIDSL